MVEYKPMARNKNKPWYIAGLAFECIQCGTCCSGPQEGYIWINCSETTLVAEYLAITAEELRQKYLKRIGRRITIIEEPDTKNCPFLTDVKDGRGCAIYPVRPNQCRTWPFWPENLAGPDDWNTAAVKCPGINRGKLYTFEEIEKLKKQKTWTTNPPQ